MNNRLFSLGDFADSFWPSTTEMHRSDSEWAFERFLEEVVLPPTQLIDNNDAVAAEAAQLPKYEEGDTDDVVEIDRLPDSTLIMAGKDPITAAGGDCNEYQSYLKSKLEIACAAVALSRASSMKPEGFSAALENHVQAAESFQLETVVSGTGHGLIMEQSKSGIRPTIASGLSALQRKTDALPGQAMSGSSRDDSDDEEFEGEAETNENMGRTDAKRARRMLSNRESARRSRRRKQEQMSELETQAGQLKDKHSSLLKHLTDMNQKCDKASVDNRILKADIETLRAKVKMAEGAVKQMTGVNPRLLAMPNTGMSFINNSSLALDTSRSFVQMQQNPSQFIHQPDNQITSLLESSQNVVRGRISPAVQPLASKTDTSQMHAR